MAVSYSHDGKGVVGGLALGGRMAERRWDAKSGGGGGGGEGRGGGWVRESG